jgi:hypothetical protein
MFVELSEESGKGKIGEGEGKEKWKRKRKQCRCQKVIYFVLRLLKKIK